MHRSQYDMLKRMHAGALRRSNIHDGTKERCYRIILGKSPFILGECVLLLVGRQKGMPTYYILWYCIVFKYGEYQTRLSRFANSPTDSFQDPRAGNQHGRDVPGNPKQLRGPAQSIS